MRALAIHVGLNAVDPSHYNGWSGTLTACENDARDMAELARSARFDVQVLLTRQATSARLLKLINDESARMVSGDRLLVTIAGHGTQLLDRNGDEADRLDEAWLLYDRMLVDDEAYGVLARFRAGVSVLFVTDCCHSGTSIRRFPGMEGYGVRYRYLPQSIAQSVYSSHFATYRQALWATPRTIEADLRCRAILLSACRDNQVAEDGERNGLFTATLKRVWAGGRFTGDYLALISQVRNAMPRYQTPGLISLGPGAGQFELERPFLARPNAPGGRNAVHV